MPKRSRKKAIAGWSTLLALIALTVLVAAPKALDAFQNRVNDAQQQQAQTQQNTRTAPSSSSLQSAGDYASVLGTARKLYRPTKAGVIEYCPPDRLQRPVCAYGELTSTLRQKAKNTGRQEIDVDPAGWPVHNDEVSIPALPTSAVVGSKSYHGWFWNRSHLVADSLGGDAVAQNLVAGTRTQNVGSAQTRGQYSGGMAYTELIARDYLDSGKGDICPLYYAATPVYNNDELIPRSVTVVIRSCNSLINQEVSVSNTANGWQIDYQTGDISPAK